MLAAQPCLHLCQHLLELQLGAGLTSGCPLCCVSLAWLQLGQKLVGLEQHQVCLAAVGRLRAAGRCEERLCACCASLPWDQMEGHWVELVMGHTCVAGERLRAGGKV